MTTRTKSKASIPDFHPINCSSCAFAFKEANTEYFRCMALPPQFVNDENEVICMRGGIVEGTDPACIYFKQRCHD